MKIKTITCHDVYNVGASLQAYALMEYLLKKGHDVEIIDYKPDYLSGHYRLGGISNPKYDRAILKQAYLLAKFPQRLLAKLGKRKKNFDQFRKNYLKVTEKRYRSCEELSHNCPEADLYIAGSDQIWNPLFPNGKDPAFFLHFVSESKKKISYAASFATDRILTEDQRRMAPWLYRMDAVSVREASALDILKTMGVEGIQVCDPIFLLDAAEWHLIGAKSTERNYLLVYDFDGNREIESMAHAIAQEKSIDIVSVFPMKSAGKTLRDMGPREFISCINCADAVLSNSFHATAFSLLFHKDFFVLNRQEAINTRMQDLLKQVGLEDRLLQKTEDLERARPIIWNQVDKILQKDIEFSKEFLNRWTAEES